MKKLFQKLENLPSWYAFGSILLYSVLLAEFFHSLSSFAFFTDSIGNILSMILKINYVITIAAGVAVWIIISLLFHLTVLLLNGQALFNRFLCTSAHFYLIPAIFILIAIFILDGIEISGSPNAMTMLQDNDSFRLAMSLVNYSFIPYYLLCTLLIRFMYKINYWKALASVAMPILSVWGITQLFTLI